MEGMLPHSSLMALQDLLSPADDIDQDSEDEKPQTAASSMTPASIGNSKKIAGKAVERNNTTKDSNNKDIWDEEEIQPGAENIDYDDPRPEPEYEIIYKQAVTTEDVYLQMSNKSQATASCDQIVVRIKLPDSKISEIDLDVKKSFIDCRCPNYKLGLHLPQPVDHKSGKAEWNGKTSTLSITLKMIREYDFMNL
ncbi:DgyrCDS9030 [Dimorphilus gyrociliatus]|uniref:DgyrCDS9030 n=1 Tax=Dimorphilus gyrociliatus TaxID=2664684 RepID=A0A7I8VW67_9ANNE|nr:DgyrCDS9030 [Dimorphilus gyrociliatus]